MALTKIYGQNFRVFVGGNAVPEATSCQVTISGNMEDAKTKDSEGSYAMEQMTSRSWNVQVDTLQADATSLRSLIDRFNTDTPQTVGWDQTETTSRTQNRTAMDAAFARSGQAILIDFTIQSNNRQNISVSCQYQGTGALS